MPLLLAGWPTRSPLRTAGTGGKPELGEEAAQESHQEIAGAVSGADMVRRAALS